MPHEARKISASGYYHVVPKSIADLILFEDDKDRQTYLRFLDEAMSESQVSLHAYCLMSNHVHLAVEDPNQKLSEAMKFLDERYGTYFSEKIGQSGGVFRRPFWSEPIENDSQLLCTVRYIHNNPVAAGICRASQYQWSSVGDYLGCTDTRRTNTNVVLDLLGGQQGFIEFSRADAATAIPFIGSHLKRHLEDSEALRIATAILGHDPRRSTTVEEAALLKQRGFSVAQITRMTGLGRNQIQRV